MSDEATSHDRAHEPAGGSPNGHPNETATFAAGCFWGVEAAFRQVPGVVSTMVGYTGGTRDNPSYRKVCTGRTGHAEAVQVVYDPQRISYDDLLAVFWDNHDPTTLNRQGPDVGSQYRSAVFVHDDEQRAAATRSKDELDASGRFRRPIVTEIIPASEFWPAEDYHQQYLEKRGLSTCRI
jgi:peptide-methionine (S)-S-oxide reductase